MHAVCFGLVGESVESRVVAGKASLPEQALQRSTGLASLQPMDRFGGTLDK